MTRPEYLNILRFLGDLWTPGLIIPQDMRDNLDCLNSITGAAWFHVEAVRLARRYG